MRRLASTAGAIVTGALSLVAAAVGVVRRRGDG
jgi:hypothetical protein